ncbi:hypothetical protein [Sphingomonas sp. KR3-1]|uniref:hypothetical protein n=1 Tax=Sphingomonas sp. KR3-1 TaxID=3156611 RepID=UPI0032B4267F
MGKAIQIGSGSALAILFVASGKEAGWWALGKALDALSTGARTMSLANIDWWSVIAVLSGLGAIACFLWEPIKRWRSKPSLHDEVNVLRVEMDRRWDIQLAHLATHAAEIQGLKDAKGDQPSD